LGGRVRGAAFVATAAGPPCSLQRSCLHFRPTAPVPPQGITLKGFSLSKHLAGLGKAERDAAINAAVADVRGDKGGEYTLPLPHRVATARNRHRARLPLPLSTERAAPPPIFPHVYPAAAPLKLLVAREPLADFVPHALARAYKPTAAERTVVAVMPK
jgi:hypothetical protein